MALEWNYIEVPGMEATIRLVMQILSHLERFPESRNTLRTLVEELTAPPKPVEGVRPERDFTPCPFNLL